MARALRIERAGGRYHLTARGNERRDIFRDDRDRQHLLDLLAGCGGAVGSQLEILKLPTGRPPWCDIAMASALRIDQAGGRYHLTARGNERRDIFRDDRDRQ